MIEKIISYGKHFNVCLDRNALTLGENNIIGGEKGSSEGCDGYGSADGVK